MLSLLPVVTEMNTLDAIWRGDRCAVMVDDNKGLRYRYMADLNGDLEVCEFPLFSEVGEPYKARFEPFFSSFTVKRGAVEYSGPPHLADRLVDALANNVEV